MNSTQQFLFAQPFKTDRIVFENVVFEDAGASDLYKEIDKETRFNELIQVLPQYYHDKDVSKADDVAMTILLAYSYYYQDEYYDALVFNRIAQKSIGKKITGPLLLANKLLTSMIYYKLGDYLGADKILSTLNPEDDFTNYLIKVFQAELNFKTGDYEKSMNNLQAIVGKATTVSKFDGFYCYYQLSKNADNLNQNMVYLTYAYLADSMVNKSNIKLIDNKIEYVFSYKSEASFIDSLSDLAKINLSIAYRKNGYFHSSLELIENLIADEITKGSSNKLGEFYIQKGITLSSLKRYNETEDAFNEALKVFLDINNNAKVSETYNLLAKNSSAKKDYNAVINQSKEAIEYANQSNDMQNLAAGYLTLSETYAIKNDLQNSQKYYKLYISTKEAYSKIEEKKSQQYIENQAETKSILQKVESEIIEREMREIELLNAIMTANQKEQENIFLKQQNELREKDLLNKQLEKDQIQRNLLLMQEKLEKEKLQSKFIEEQNEKERQQRLNEDQKNKLEILNAQNAATEKENQFNQLEIKAAKNRQIMFIAIMIIMVLFIAFMIFFIARSRKQNKIIEKNNLIIQKTNSELITTIEQVNIQKALIETKNEEITDSIAYAKRIQNAILPHDAVVGKSLGENFILYRPKDIVAGDFYWMSEKGDNVLFAVADCTGHGVPGAMVSVVCHAALTRSIREFNLTNPDEILNKVRDLVLETFERSGEGVNDGMDIALCNFNPKTRVLKFAGANNGMFIIRNGAMIELKADKQPIGKFIHAKPFTSQEIVLEKGDQIYLFSDGFADQFGGEKGKKLKSQTFKEMLIEHRDLAMSKQKEMLEKAFDMWRGELEQIDDVCVWGVKI